ncbi:MAG: HEPN domain-containing protein [Cytophagaceae bacterium]|nr:HEPN domain-containing protein [Cytophagaceae bacterium]
MNSQSPSILSLEMIENRHLALERAIDCLSDTDIIIKNELNFASVNRAYYSVFYAISALLYSKDIFVKTHSGAISKFNELFIKESVFDLETQNQ